MTTHINHVFDKMNEEQPTKEILPQIQSSENFKLLLKYMRNWKEHIANVKYRK